MYICSKCGKQVIVIPNEKPIKPCNCNATIIADMGSTTMQGTSNIKQK